jgi:uncharacterized protein (DUF1330 family)
MTKMAGHRLLIYAAACYAVAAIVAPAASLGQARGDWKNRTRRSECPAGLRRPEQYAVLQREERRLRKQTRRAFCDEARKKGRLYLLPTGDRVCAHDAWLAPSTLFNSRAWIVLQFESMDKAQEWWNSPARRDAFTIGDKYAYFSQLCRRVASFARRSGGVMRMYELPE